VGRTLLSAAVDVDFDFDLDFDFDPDVDLDFDLTWPSTPKYPPRDLHIPHPPLRLEEENSPKDRPNAFDSHED
jgi:hypothetical protein